MIAAGGFGITYLAIHNALGRRVAIKEHFPRQFAYRESATSQVRSTDQPSFVWALNRFLDEGRTLAKLSHPNVVDVSDVFEANGTAYMALAYEEGSTLEASLQSLGRRPTQAEIDGWLAPLLDALAYVHSRGLLHRDVKPSNIIIRPNGSPCLIDFGAARQSIAERSQLTGIVTPGYSPPEQHDESGRGQREASDIYALAATCYRAIAGDVPPSGALRGAHDDLTPAVEFTGIGYRQAFLQAIDAGLRLKLSERPQSVEDWRAALFSDGEPAQPSRSQPIDVAPLGGVEVPSTPRLRRSHWWSISIVAGALVIAGMGAMAAVILQSRSRLSPETAAVENLPVTMPARQAQPSP
ncbi:MAG: serine/threonine protein kinase, partial [Proteobacteria bacterium]|nr:serine/threonine protein kinase [Pseudomonadota bacterium]